MTIGERLATVRRSRGMSQEQLAIRTKIPVGTIRYHEYSKREMTAIDLFKYAKALHVWVDHFEGCKPIRRRKK